MSCDSGSVFSSPCKAEGFVLAMCHPWPFREAFKSLECGRTLIAWSKYVFRCLSAWGRTLPQSRVWPFGERQLVARPALGLLYCSSCTSEIVPWNVQRCKFIIINFEKDQRDFSFLQFSTKNCFGGAHNLNLPTVKRCSKWKGVRRAWQSGWRATGGDERRPPPQTRKKFDRKGLWPTNGSDGESTGGRANAILYPKLTQSGCWQPRLPVKCKTPATAAARVKWASREKLKAIAWQKCLF